MVNGSRFFYPRNRRVFDDPRSVVVIDDAKSYFAATDQRFDAIFSEPSNPWVSGVSGLFTTEFYQRVRQYLSDDGVFGQWLHLYEIQDGLVLSVLAAIHENFPSYQVFLTGGGDLLVVASKRPRLPTPDWSIFQRPPVSDELCSFVPLTPEVLEATRLIDRATLAPLLDDYRGSNSDFFPVLDLSAEKARFLRSVATGFQALSSDRFSIDSAFSGRRIGPATQEDAPVPTIPRMLALATGAALRHESAGRPGDGGALESARREKSYRLQVWSETLSAPQPPADWRLWTRAALEVEADVNGGTAGAADEGVFRAAYAFMARHGAPAESWDALRFRHGLATWDCDEALETADRLIPLAGTRPAWVNPDELRAGVAVCRLLRHDPAGARIALNRLRATSTMDPGDVRLRLLESHTARLERVAASRRPVTAAR